MTRILNLASIYLPTLTTKFLLKIGYTSGNLATRVRKLNNTSVPTKFDVAFYYEASAPRELEAVVHQNLKDYRKYDNREFFSCTLVTQKRLF